jgi:hypothetical protein
MYSRNKFTVKVVEIKPKNRAAKFEYDFKYHTKNCKVTKACEI